MEMFAIIPPEGLRENPLLPLPASDDSRQSLANGHIVPMSTSISMWTFMCLYRMKTIVNNTVLYSRSLLKS